MADTLPFASIRGQALSGEQRASLASEQEPGAGADELVAIVRAAVGKALAQLRATPRDELLTPRDVGHKQLPSNVIGLLFHAAEHTQRHTGQAVSTARIVRALGASLTDGAAR